MSDGGPWWPKTWQEAIPNAVWTILALGFGLDFVTNVISGNFGHALVALFGLGGLIAVLVHRDEVKSALKKVNPNWIVAVFSLFLLVLVMSPFIEQQRWPFSYPEPKLVAENAELKNAIDKANGATGREKELADKWRFATVLRQQSGATCKYHIFLGPRAERSFPFWQELLRSGGWIGEGGFRQSDFQNGITLRITGDNSPCAGTLQRALADIYPNPPSKIARNQQSDYLSSCAEQSGQDCVQIEIDY